MEPYRALCPFPGCENLIYASQAWACGHHQIAIKALASKIGELSTRYGFRPRREALLPLAQDLTPYVFLPTKGSAERRYSFKAECQPRLRPVVPASTLAVISGISLRVAYRLKSEGILHVVGGGVATSEAIMLAVATTELVNVPEAAREIGVSHRYLRHLVHEHGLDLGAIPFPYKLYHAEERYFWRSDLPGLQREVGRIRGLSCSG